MSKEKSIFDFNNPIGYLKNHKVLYCKNKNDVNKFIFRQDTETLCENHSYEITVDSLIGRKYLLGNHEIDDGVDTDTYKKIYLININDLVDSDGIYDIELIGNIYKVYYIIDNLIVMKVINNFSDNKRINIPEFKILKPYPLINTIYSKIQIGIEMNHNFKENTNEKIHLNFKGLYFNMLNKNIILRNSKYNIYFTECKDVGCETSNLMIMNGKCIPIIYNPLEYFI
jgi:hypothetical protein